MIYLDTETKSDVSIKSGTNAYVNGKHFAILIVTYAFDDEPVRLWQPCRGESVPRRLREAVAEGETLVIHNSPFDRRVLNKSGILGQAIGPEQIHDTMVQAMAHGLPGGLDALGKAFGLTGDMAKMADGRRLIQQFCVPRRTKLTEVTFNNPDDHAEAWSRFCDYAMRDVEAMRAIHKKMPVTNYPKLEHAIWVVDQAINDRGIPVDTALAEAAIQEDAKARQALNKQTAEATGGEVSAATQGDKLLMHLAAQMDVWLPDLRASTVESLLEKADLPAEIAHLAELRLASSQNSAAKYRRVMQVQVNGRLNDTMQMYGASRTGRDAGRVFQPQNLKRPVTWGGLEGAELDAAIERDVNIIKTGQTLDVYGNKAKDVLGDCVRGVINASENHKLVVADLSNIEGRGLVWLSGEEWKLQYFRQFDAGEVAFDNYVAAYAKAFNVAPEDVTKANRQIGKVMELGLGYGGGVAAFLSFANVYRMDVQELAQAVWDTGDRAHLFGCESKHEWAVKNNYHAGLNKFQYAACEYLKQKWREAHPLTVQFWEDLENTFKLATEYDRETFRLRHLAFRRVGHWLYVRLPSGRCLVYMKPKVENGALSFMGQDSFTRTFRRIKTYSGKLAENVTSGTARDVMFHRMPDIEKAGYPIILRVHDELVCETPDEPWYHEDDLAAMMAKPHPWSTGLPLAAAGFQTHRYRKD